MLTPSSSSTLNHRLNSVVPFSFPQNYQENNTFHLSESTTSRFIQECQKLNIIDAQGKTQNKNLPPLPPLSQATLDNIKAWLEKKIKINLNDTLINCSIKNFLNSLDLEKGRLFIVGGALKKFLGIQWFQEAIKNLIGEEKCKTLMAENGLELHLKEGEVDLRFVTHSAGEDPRVLAENFIKKLISSTFPPNINLRRYCNEIRKASGPFEVFDSYIAMENGIKVSDTFLITTKGEIGEEIDLMIASTLKEANALAHEDLILDITDFLNNTKATPILTGKHSLGWQSVITYIGKIIQVQHVNKKVWTRVMVKTTECYHCLEPIPNDVYNGLNVAKLVTQLARASRIHLQNNSTASTLLIINSIADLLQRGFHEADVEQLSKLFEGQTDLPPPLKTTVYYADKLPAAIVLTCLKLGTHINPDKVPSKYNKWQIQLPQTTQEALDKLIAFEKQKVFYQYIANLNSLLTSLDVLPPTSNNSNFHPTLEIVKNKLPHHLEFACFRYFKNQEHDWLLTEELVTTLLPTLPLRAVQMFHIHLRHIKEVTKSHLILCESLINTLLTRPKTIPPLEGLNHTLSIASALGTFSKSHESKIVGFLENSVKKLLSMKYYKIGCLILKSTKEAGFCIDSYLLWLESFRGLFEVESDVGTIVKFWQLTDQIRGTQKIILKTHHLDLFAKFISTLYSQNSYLDLAEDLMKKITPESDSNPNGINSMIQKRIQEIQSSKTILLTSQSQQKEPIFEALESWKKNPLPTMDVAVQEEFIQWLQRVHSKASKEICISIPFNYLLEGISKIQFSPNNEITLIEKVKSIVLFCLENRDFSESLADLLAFLTAHQPDSQEILKLLIRFISNERKSVVTDSFIKTLGTYHNQLMEKLFTLGNHQEICLLINFIENSNIKIEISSDLYYRIYLPSVKNAVIKQKLGGYIPHYLENVIVTLKDRISTIEKSPPPSHIEELETFIEELTELYREYGQTEWIEFYFLVKSQTSSRETAGPVILKWIQKLNQHTLSCSVMPLIEILYDHFPSMKRQVFNHLLSFSDKILPRHLQAYSKILLSCSRSGLLKKSSPFIHSKVTEFVNEALRHKNSFELQTTALDIIEEGIKDQPQHEHLVRNNLNVFTYPSLKLRIWSLFRIRFHDYLLKLPVSQGISSPWIKAWHLSHRVLESLADKKNENIFEPFEKIVLDFYLNEKTPLEKWMTQEKMGIHFLKDLESLFLTLHHFSKDDKIPVNHLKKIRKVFLKFFDSGMLFTSLNTTMMNLTKLYSSLLVNTSDFSLFIKGFQAINGLINNQIVNGSSKIPDESMDLFCHFLSNATKFSEKSQEHRIFEICHNLQVTYGKIITNIQHEKMAKAFVNHHDFQSQTFENTKDKDTYVTLRSIAKIPLSPEEQKHYNEIHFKPLLYRVPSGILQINGLFVYKIKMFLLTGMFFYCFLQIYRSFYSHDQK